jgi:hypothetical protein
MMTVSFFLPYLSVYQIMAQYDEDSDIAVITAEEMEQAKPN